MPIYAVVSSVQGKHTGELIGEVNGSWYLVTKGQHKGRLLVIRDSEVQSITPLG
jgi:hypothetical protein